MAKRRESGPNLIPKKPLRRFDFQLVQTRLEGLCVNVDRDMQRRVKEAVVRQNRALEHELVTLNLLVRFAINSYNAAGYLVAQTPEDSARRPNFALVLPAINRQLLDLLFSLVYMLDDLPERILKYGKSGWRELKEQNEQYRNRFAGDPEWKDFFRSQKEANERLSARLEITETEQKTPSSVPYWWTPSAIKDEPTASRSFLRWLYKWFYQDTSEQAHMSSSGLFMVAPMLLADIVGGEEQHAVNEYVRRMYHYLHFSRTAFFTLAIMTEVNHFFGLGNDAAIGYLWKMFSENSPEAKDMFGQRYEKLRSRSAAQKASS